MNERKIGILLSYLNIAIQALLGFIYVPLLLHYIGTSEYGLYQLIGSLIAYFGIMDFGLTAAVTRFFAKYRALKDYVAIENLLALALRGYIMATFIAVIIGIICYFNIDIFLSKSLSPYEIKESKDIFILLIFNIALTLSTLIFRAIINGYERFLFLKGLETIQLILQPILVILLLEKNPTAFSVALAQTILNSLLIISRGYYCFYRLRVKIKFHFWDWNLISEFRRLSSSIFLECIVDQIFWKSNQVILGIIRGTVSVAVYSISSLVYMNYMALSTAISGVYLPYVTSLIAHSEPKEKISLLFIEIGRWQYYLLSLVASGFIIFGMQFIEIWAGKSFHDAYWITLIIIIPFSIDLIQNIGLSILQALNQYTFRAAVYTFIGILNICLAIPLAIKFGGIGCAIATGTSMFLGNGLCMNWYYAKHVGIDIKSFWLQIWDITRVVIFCTIIGYGGNMLFESQSKWIFIMKIIIYMSFYIFCIYRGAMNTKEREKVKMFFTH